MGGRLTAAARLSRLGAEVSRSLEEARTASGGASRVRMKLVSRQPLPARRRSRLRTGRVAGILAAAAAIALAVSFGFAGFTGRSQAALTFAINGRDDGASGAIGAFIAAPEAGELPIAFSDGTRVVLAPSARARVSAVTPNGARLLVESGKIHADVVHTGKAAWAVEAGPFEVEVTGTSFDVAWDPAAESVVVTLTDGSVMVRGCTLGDAGRRVVRGEELRASCKDPVAATKSASPTVAAPPSVSADALPDAFAEEPESQLARAAPRKSAAAALDAPASASASVTAPATSNATPKAPPRAIEEVSAADLLLVADSARYEGDFDRAVVSLESVRRRFPGTDHAAGAAFELGRISFDARRDFAAAGDWFDTYLRERPGGALVREALGRALEARHRAGQAARAEQLAGRYLRAYPDGPHATLARRLAASNRGGR